MRIGLLFLWTSLPLAAEPGPVPREVRPLPSGALARFDAAPEPGQRLSPAGLVRWSGDGRRLLAVWPGTKTNGSQFEKWTGPASRRKLSRPSVLVVWDVNRGEPVWQAEWPARVVEAALDRSGTTVRAVGDDGHLRTWENGSKVGTDVKLDLVPVGFGWPATFLPDGRLVVCESSPVLVCPRAYSPAGELIGHDFVRSLPDDEFVTARLFAGGLVAQKGRRVDPLTGRPLPPLAASAPIRRFVGFPIPTDGPFVAGRVHIEKDTEAFLWEAATGRPIAPLPALLPDWNVAAVSPDGRLLASADGTFVVLHNLREPGPRRLPAVGAQGISFSPDGQRLATTHVDGTVLLWAVPPGGRSEWKSTDAGRLWSDLAASESKPAWQALWHLLDHPRPATELLADDLRPAPPTTNTAELIARLDDPKYAVREAASKELAARGAEVESALRATFRQPRSEEQRQRLAGLLAGLTPDAPPPAEVLRGLRAVWLLERIGTPEAVKVLEKMATGAPGSRVTQDSKAAVGRLTPAQ